MTPVLTPEQGADIQTVQRIASQFDADVVIIGACALLCFLDTVDRLTRDIDLVVALDLDDFKRLTDLLQEVGWAHIENKDHRWRSPTGTIVDLLPAGTGLRVAKKIVWPRSEFSMSLVGFDHVFERCVEVELSPGILCDVAPLPVIALLKITAYLEDRHRRAKDLDDLKLLLRSYASGTDRIFSDDVFAAHLEDIDLANAYLLALDIKAFAGPEELQLVKAFLDEFMPGAESDLLNDRHGIRFRKQLAAFRGALALD
jgi:predicted nucleotidyltransferase